MTAFAGNKPKAHRLSVRSLEIRITTHIDSSTRAPPVARPPKTGPADEIDSPFDSVRIVRRM